MTHPFFEELQDELKQSPLWQSIERANQLQEILDACEAANFKHLARIDQLEQLVKYMYRCYVLGHDWGAWGAPERQWVEERMEQLGLLEVDNEEVR